MNLMESCVLTGHGCCGGILNLLCWAYVGIGLWKMLIDELREISVNF